MEKYTSKEIENAMEVLKKSGYLVSDLFQLQDIIDRAKELESPEYLTMDDAEEVAEILSMNHDASIGINWHTIDEAIRYWAENKY